MWRLADREWFSGLKAAFEAPFLGQGNVGP